MEEERGRDTTAAQEASRHIRNDVAGPETYRVEISIVELDRRAINERFDRAIAARISGNIVKAILRRHAAQARPHGHAKK